jgi:hypothetical protein
LLISIGPAPHVWRGYRRADPPRSRKIEQAFSASGIPLPPTLFPRGLALSDVEREFARTQEEWRKCIDIDVGSRNPTDTVRTRHMVGVMGESRTCGSRRSRLADSVTPRHGRWVMTTQEALVEFVLFAVPALLLCLIHGSTAKN